MAGSETTKQSTNNFEPRLSEKIFSACTGALTTSFLMTPFDVVKTRLQSQSITMPAVPQVQTISIKPGGSLSAVPHSVPAICIPPATDGYCVCTELRTSSNRVQWSSSECILQAWNPGKTGVIGPYGWHMHGKDTYRIPMTRPAAHHEMVPRFTGTLDGMVKISRYEGVKSLWRGLSPTLVASIPSTVIYFVGYDYLRQWMSREINKISAVSWLDQYAPLLAGCAARTCSATVISPLELIRTRMQSSATRNLQNVLIGVRGMVQSEGIGTLYRGLVPTLWRDVPFSALYWFGYERWKNTVRPMLSDAEGRQTGTQTFFTAFLSGALSGIISATLTTPFDVAKTRRQVEMTFGGKPHTLWPMLKSIVLEDGWRGLFSGLTPRLLKVAPACAIMISSYEIGKRLFASRRHDEGHCRRDSNEVEEQ